MQIHASPSASEALDVLVRRRADFLASVRRRVQGGADAEDIVQTAFLQCFEHHGSVRSEALARWFQGILANATADHFRRRARLARALRALAVEPFAPSGAEDVHRRATPQRASLLLDRLSSEYRHALHVVYLESGGLPRLAAEAQITVNNAAVRVFRARKAARKLARELGESISTAAVA
jgi:RNA polymerase sigma-70 factor (ECF subfamily)